MKRKDRYVVGYRQTDWILIDGAGVKAGMSLKEAKQLARETDTIYKLVEVKQKARKK